MKAPPRRWATMEAMRLAPRHARPLALAALLVLLLPGCLRSERALVLRADGSGTFSQDTTVDVAKARAALEVQRRMQAAALPGNAGEDEEADPFAELAPARIREDLAGIQGVTLDEATLESQADGARLVQRIRVSFTSLHALALSGAMGDMDIRLSPAEDGAWLLERRLVYEGSEAAFTKQREEAQRRLREASLKPFEAMLQEFSLTLSAQLPGTILEVNGEKVPAEAAKRPILWRIGYTELLEDLQLRHRILFRPPEDLKLAEFQVTLDEIENAREERALAREEAAAERDG